VLSSMPVPLHGTYRRTHDFTIKGVPAMGAGSGGLPSRSGVHGLCPDRESGGEVPQKMKQNVKLVYNF